jgi:hypothetical protein
MNSLKSAIVADELRTLDPELETTGAGAKEHEAVQPTFAVRERAPDENLAVGKMGDS